MSKWFYQAILHPRASLKRFDRGYPAAIAIVGLVLGTCVALIPTNGQAESAAVVAEATADESTEDSLLVAIREAPPVASEEANETTPTAGGEALEPIAESSGHSPEIAITDEEEQAATDFGAGLSQLTGKQAAARGLVAPQSSTEEPAPLAAKLAEPKSAPQNTGTNAATHARVPFEPARFNGIQVGKSTQSELVAAWGEPAESISTTDGSVLTYHPKPFEAVEILVSSEELVTAIKILLSGTIEPKALAQQLSLDQFAAITVTDEQGKPLGMAFPERGVLFTFSTDDEGLINAFSESSPMVSYVTIRQLDARAFALRAEQHLHGPYQQNIDDLKTAITLDPELAEAHWLLAEIYMATGQADLAEVESAEALAIEPDNAAYKLRHAQSLALLAQYDDAVGEVRAVLDQQDAPPIVKAQALHEMARLASIGDAEIAAKAITFEQRAIEIADRLATSGKEKERRAARQLLVESHLSIAEEVARQSFHNKLHSLSQWIDRASGLAEEHIASDGGSVEMRLIIAQRVLAALASFKPTIDPTPWVVEAEDAAKTLAEQFDDELWQQRLKWELGIVYYNALRVEHLRHETTAALRYGQQALESLAEGAVPRQAVHSSEQLVGQLYFQIGAIHAVHKQDHAEAAEWYDKAAALLTAPRPVSELYSPRREGEVLVSIGVTYWQTDRQSRAVELTRAGTDLVELAVEEGILAKSSLAVPYGNLATMYQELGETTNAAKYADLLKTIAPNKTADGARHTAIASRPTSNRSGSTTQTKATKRQATAPLRK